MKKKTNNNEDTAPLINQNMQMITKELKIPDEVDEYEPIVENFRYIQLINGDEIIAELVESDSIKRLESPVPFLQVKRPLVINQEEDSFHLFPLVVFTDQEVIALNWNTIVTVTSIHEEMENLYLHFMMINGDEEGFCDCCGEPLDGCESDPDLDNSDILDEKDRCKSTWN